MEKLGYLIKVRYYRTYFREFRTLNLGRTKLVLLTIIVWVFFVGSEPGHLGPVQNLFQAKKDITLISWIIFSS